MEQQDYLQRLIEQLGRVLGKISSNLIGLKNKGQIEDGFEMTNQTLKGELDFDIQKLINLPPDNFIKTLRANKGFNNENINKLADILLLIAEYSQGQEKKMLYRKCLMIYEYLEKAENVYSIVREGKIEQIKNVL
ncbi:MAG: hypothetical protein JST58_17010 [Bacteroidetes bacterium]|nr:hypothetical protein [Bacteroidota bacterium]